MLKAKSPRTEAKGAVFRFGRTVVSLGGETRVSGLHLDDGSVIAADLVLVAVGSRPATGWLEGSGLVLRNGVVCDAQCRALNGAGRIAAAGDVAVWPHAGYGDREMRIEHWTNAGSQAAAAALGLIGAASRPYAPLPSFWSDQFSLKLQSLGLPGEASRFDLVAGSLDARKFVVECHDDSGLKGVLALNMAPRLARYRGPMEAALAARAMAPAG